MSVRCLKTKTPHLGCGAKPIPRTGAPLAGLASAVCMSRLVLNLPVVSLPWGLPPTYRWSPFPGACSPPDPQLHSEGFRPPSPSLFMALLGGFPPHFRGAPLFWGQTSGTGLGHKSHVNGKSRSGPSLRPQRGPKPAPSGNPAKRLVGCRTAPVQNPT